MIDGRRILAVCPARGGSKGIPLKNLKSFRGVPLVATVGHTLREVACIDRAVVSTDHPEIARTAEAAGLAAPFRRPEELSGDRIGDLEVLTHALVEMERIDATTYDIVVMLQPTSPLRRPGHVSDCIALLVQGGWDAVWTLSPTDSKEHPLKQLTVDSETAAMDYYDSRGGQVIARQQLTPVYHRNGVAYAITRSCLLDQKSIKGARTGALVIDEAMISIDTLWDLELAEYLASRRERPRTDPVPR